MFELNKMSPHETICPFLPLKEIDHAKTPQGYVSSPSSRVGLPGIVRMERLKSFLNAIVVEFSLAELAWDAARSCTRSVL